MFASARTGGSMAPTRLHGSEAMEPTMQPQRSPNLTPPSSRPWRSAVRDVDAARSYTNREPIPISRAVTTPPSSRIGVPPQTVHRLRGYRAGGTTTMVLPFVAPRAPVLPLAPVLPVAPVYPVAPVLPVAPVSPVAPVYPVAPVLPVAPVYPVAPVLPVAPVCPVCPVAPVSPVLPCGPGGPAGTVKQALKESVISVAMISFEYFMMIPFV